LSQQLETAMKEESDLAVLEADLPRQDGTVSAPIVNPDEQPVHLLSEESAEAPAFDLELQSSAPANVAGSNTLAADSLLADLAGEMESMASNLGKSSELAHSTPQNSAPASSPASEASARSNSGNGAHTSSTTEHLNSPLGDLFEEFRSELGEMNNPDEDLETHYNLGIAYREMGLLEEAISEFQRVASSTDKGPAFRYAMQCSTLLGLAFMEKGQPAIAAIWYQRALKTPGLDQESILALQYDLGVAQELAGDKQGAYTSFSQVYAMNIDYRDVSERIALLGKAR
jgi:tetratricopeptide (TPR) repeat protein